jgi:hypothetical protein
LPEFWRRGTVHVIVIALIVAALAPQAVAATPPDSHTEQLLAAVEASPVSAVALRGTASDRSLASFAASATTTPRGTESFHAQGVARPPSITTEVSLERVSVAVPSIAVPSGPATISGTASWYCCTMNWGDAAVVALPIALGGHYYPPPGGGTVIVCADRCAELPIGDACACNWGREGQKVVDLSPAAWAAVTDKDRYVYGIVSVTLYLN